jgi:hypothetical protein
LASARRDATHAILKPNDLNPAPHPNAANVRRARQLLEEGRAIGKLVLTAF